MYSSSKHDKKRRSNPLISNTLFRCWSNNTCSWRVRSALHSCSQDIKALYDSLAGLTEGVYDTYILYRSRQHCPSYDTTLSFTLVQLDLTLVASSSASTVLFLASALSRSAYHTVTTSNNRVENNTVASKNINQNATRTTSAHCWVRLRNRFREITEFNNSL